MQISSQAPEDCPGEYSSLYYVCIDQCNRDCHLIRAKAELKAKAAEDAHSRRHKVQVLMQDMTRRYLYIGTILLQAEKKQDWKSLGYESEVEYWRDSFGFGRATGYHLKGIVQDFGGYISEDASLLSCDYTRLRELRSINLTEPESVKEWLNKAANLPSIGWKDEIAKAKGKTAPSDCDHPTHELYSKCTVCGSFHKVKADG